MLSTRVCCEHVYAFVLRVFVRACVRVCVRVPRVFCGVRVCVLRRAWRAQVNADSRSALTAQLAGLEAKLKALDEQISFARRASPSRSRPVYPSTLLVC